MNYETVVYTKHCEYTENWQQELEVYDSFDEIRARYHVNDPLDQFFAYGGYATDYLLMNWGYDGAYDDGYYSISPGGVWSAGNSNYQYSKTLYYGFY